MKEEILKLLKEVKDVLGSLKYSWKIFKGLIEVRCECDTQHFKCKIQDNIQIHIMDLKKVPLFEVLPIEFVEVLNSWCTTEQQQKDLKDFSVYLSVPKFYKQIIERLLKETIKIEYKNYKVIITESDDKGNYFILTIDSDLVTKITYLVCLLQSDPKKYEDEYNEIKKELPKFLQVVLP